MSEVPGPIRGEVITELYRQAAELDWELLSLAQKKLQYRRWVEDPRVGGRLRAFLDDHRIGTWIKDTPMKEYARVQEGFGSMAIYAVSRYVPAPEMLVQNAIGDEWAIKRGSLDEKPMHCVATSQGKERYVCWGKPSTFRDLAWAALDKVIAMPIRPMIIVTPQEGQVVSVAERKFQQSIAEHCGIEICYLTRRVQLSRLFANVSPCIALAARCSRCMRRQSGSSTTTRRLVQMVSEQSGLTTAKQILWSSTPSDGFTTLWERGRLDLMVEAHVLKTEFAPLFADADHDQARDRLESYGWRPPR